MIDKVMAEPNSTDLLCDSTITYLNKFYPNYVIDESTLKNIEKDGANKLKEKFVFYKLLNCKVDEVEELSSFFLKKLQKLFTAAYSVKNEFCYGIVSNKTETSLIIGFKKDNVMPISKQMLEGMLPGMQLGSFSGPSTIENSYNGFITGVPQINKDSKGLQQDLSALMRSLNGTRYSMLVLCKPIEQSEIMNKLKQAIIIRDTCFGLSKRTIADMKGESTSSSQGKNTSESHATQKSSTNNIGFSGGIITGLMAAVGGFFIGGPVGAIAGFTVGSSFNVGHSSTEGTSESLTKGYSETITKAMNSSQTITRDVQNGFALELMKAAELEIERLKKGRNIGLWQNLVTISSDSALATNLIQGYLYSEIASDNTDILPPVVMSFKDGNLAFPKDFFENSEQKLCSYVTSEELCGICNIPIENTIGFKIERSKDFAIDGKLGPNDKLLGQVCEYLKPVDNMQFGLSPDDINKHCFVSGVTGSGKTNTVKAILKSIDTPFLVIEPAKKEYRNLDIEELNIFTLGRPELNSLRLNPFYIIQGVSPLQHIDLLKDLFCAAFSMYGPMPYILEKCLYNIYLKKGWNLTLGYHPLLVNKKNGNELFDSDKVKEQYSYESHKYLFPTMQDLKDEVDYYVEHELSYEGEVKGNIRGAIKSRIESLCVGGKGFMLNTNDFPDINSLLNKDTIIELEGLADDADKAFALGLLIILINEFRQIDHIINHKKGLKHVLVIEEAHRLLKNGSSEYNIDLGNPKGKAVEHFTNMLSEMRAYGQGVIVVEQIPSKLAPDVIKNSSNKIVHRIIANDDQRLIGNSIGLSDQEVLCLGHTTTGYAICHKEGMTVPVRVKVNEVCDKSVLDSKLYNKNLEGRFNEISQSIIQNSIPQDLSCWAVKTLMSILVIDNVKEFSRGLDFMLEQLSKLLVKKGVSVIVGVSLKDMIASVIAKNIERLLVQGMFSNNKLPDNNLLKYLEKAITTPEEKCYSALRENLSNLYRSNLAEKVEQIAMGLVITDFIQGKNVAPTLNDLLLVSNDTLTNTVFDALGRIRYAR